MVRAFLWFHIATGGLALVAGIVTLFATRKGSRRHVRWGVAFWISMTAMAVSGIAIAMLRPTGFFIFIGLLSLYLINTGRNALTRSGGAVDRATRAWFALIIACFVAAVVLGSWSLVSRQPVLGSPFFLYFGLAFDALIFVILDWRLISKGGAVGKARIVDHLWRMIAALFFGTFALFVANPRLYPSWFTDTGLNFVPCAILLGAVAYWVLAVHRERWPAEADAAALAPRLTDGARAPRE